MLRYVTSTLTAFALASTVNAFAQEPAPAQGDKQQAPKETLTGCVMEAKTTDGGTAYVLNNAEGGSSKMYVLAGSSQSQSDWAKMPTRRLKSPERSSSQRHRQARTHLRAKRTWCALR